MGKQSGAIVAVVAAVLAAGSGVAAQDTPGDVSFGTTRGGPTVHRWLGRELPNYYMHPFTITATTRGHNDQHYAYGGTYGERPATEPATAAWFENSVRHEMDGIETALRERVHDGLVDPRALDDLRDRRDDVERDMDAASVDGVITPDERTRVQHDVDGLRTLAARFAVAGEGGAAPAGPQPK